MKTINEKLTDRRRIAYHEAGHAMAAVLCGWRVREVSIRPRPGSNGRCRADSKIGQLQSYLFYIVSGPVAGRMYHLRQGINPVDCIAGADKSLIKEALDLHGRWQWSIIDTTQQPDVLAATKTAATVMRSNWSHVRNFADLLMKLETVDGSTANTLFSSCRGV